MKKGDLILVLLIILLFLPFFISRQVYEFYAEFNSSHGFVTSFIKFAVLASIGEVIGLRIRKGRYDLRGFGLLPRIIVWGFLGIAIKGAFVIFSAGTPAILSYLGMTESASSLNGPLSVQKVIVAFSISLALNLVFSPVLMTFHKITDSHIMINYGSLRCLVTPIGFRSILSGIDWNIHWGFVLKKTIPFFWIPAHTITFMLPVDFQILFAAVLGVVLGIILAFAAAAKQADY